jgi:hypothetical protein
LATIRWVELGDFDAVEAMMERRLPGSGTAWRKRTAWQWEANPWQKSGRYGAVLANGGRIVGYHFGQAQPLWMSGSSSVAIFTFDLFIEEDFRRGLDSMGLIRAITTLEPEGIVATTTSNEVAVGIWTRLMKAQSAAEGEISLVKPLKLGSLALAAAERALLNQPQTVVARPWHAGKEESFEIELPNGWVSKPLGYPFDAPAALWREVREHFLLTTDRDVAWLQWRYGSSSPGGALVGLFDAKGDLRAWYSYRLSERGRSFPLRVFKLLDMIALPSDAQAIEACAADSLARGRRLAHIVEARGMRPEFRRGLLAAGFSERRLPSNPFLVCAKPNRLSTLPPAHTWHLVPGDGDGGFW